MILMNSLYIQNLQNNLLSVLSVTDNGYSVTFSKIQATVNRNDGSVVLRATKRDNMYVVNESLESAAIAKENNETNLIKWHQRYGHLNVIDLRKMKNDQMVYDLNFTSNVNGLDCEICAKCKFCALPFKRFNNRESEILALVHSNICRSMSTESLEGAKYFVTLIDDCTRRTEVLMLRNRSDVLELQK